MKSNSTLVVDTRGSYVSKSGNRFILKTCVNKKEYSADTIRQLLFVAPASISTNAIELAIEKKIDIVYCDWKGKPIARTYSPYMGGTTLTRRCQLEAYKSSKGVVFVLAIVDAKVRSQTNFLKSLAKDHKKIYKLQVLVKKLNPFHSFATSQSVDEIRQKLLGIEGSCAASYFKGLGFLTGYSKRDPQATDPFNILLNYTYGILYAEVEKCCVLAGLDPFLGFYHTDRYGKPSLVLDVMELFRVAIADRAVITLLNRKEIQNGDFDKRGDTILTKKGKRKIINAVLKRMSAVLVYQGKKRALQDIILAQTRDIAAYLLGHNSTFKPFIYK